MVEQTPLQVIVLRPYGYWAQGDLIRVVDQNTPCGEISGVKTIFGRTRLDAMMAAGIVGPVPEPAVEEAESKPKFRRSRRAKSTEADSVAPGAEQPLEDVK